MIAWHVALLIGAALVLIIAFWLQEWREERRLRLREEIQRRQAREAWERHLKATCAFLARERHRRHTRWMQ